MNRLPKRVRWLEHKPTAYMTSDLYFVVERVTGSIGYIRIVRGSRRLLKWWANRLIHSLDLNAVTVLYPKEDMR